MINFTKSALLFSVMFLFFACSTSNPPAIGDASSPTYKHNQVVWYDLVTPNMDGAKEFYGSILGWTFSDYRVGGRKYVIAYNNSKPVAGMIEVKEANKSVWIPAVSVKDIVATSTMAKNSSSTVLMPVMDIPGKGKQTFFQGPQGEDFSLLQSAKGDPSNSSSVSENAWLWAELWADNPMDAAKYYSTTFELKVDESTYEGQPYWVMESRGDLVAGIIKNPVSNQSAQWVPYVKNSNPKAVLDKVKASKGQVVLYPSNQVRSGKVGILMDPDGALICIQSRS